MKFIGLVATRMQEQDVTTGELAEKTGYSAGHVSNFLSGRRRPTKTFAAAVIKALKIPSNEHDDWMRAASIDFGFKTR